MRVENPVFSMYGDVGGVKLIRDGTYAFDGAAGSAGISFQFPAGWDKFDKIVFYVEAENLRPDDGVMALIVNDGYNVWRPTIAKNPYPWVGQGAGILAFPVSLFTSGAVSFQLNETFGHSTNWNIAIKNIEFQDIEKKSIVVDNPEFLVCGDTCNTARNESGSYTFTGDASALICFQFPYGWDDYENVTFFIDDVENHVADMTMSLIVKTRYKSWATIDPAHGDRYPILDEGSNSLTYPIFAFTDGASLQFNQYGHSTNWTLHVTKLVFHDGLISDLEAV